MVNHIASFADQGFEWTDLVDPSLEELHPALVKDCLQPDHLPKYERMENYSFIIIGFGYVFN